MAQPYVGELRIFAGNFAPAGWEFCRGQLLPISENETLFQLIGTMFGGDGQENFALPDLQGRVALHQGAGSDGVTYQLGEKGGTEAVTLTASQLPPHTHALLASDAPTSTADPTGAVLGRPSSMTPYIVDPPAVNMAASSVAAVGGSQPHENVQPYLVITPIISLFGIFPSPT